MEKVDGRKQRDVKKSGFSSVLKEGMNLKQARTNREYVHNPFLPILISTSGWFPAPHSQSRSWT